MALLRIELKKMEKGHSLLKRKTEALKVLSHTLQKQMEEEHRKLDAQLGEAALALARVGFIAGESVLALAEAANNTKLDVEIVEEAVSGVRVQQYRCSVSSGDVGLLDSRELLGKTMKEYQSILSALIGLAGTQRAHEKVQAVLKKETRRTNALEYRLIPRTQQTLNYIDAEMEEQEREDFFRIKMAQKSKTGSEGKERNETIQTALSEDRDPELFF